MWLRFFTRCLLGSVAILPGCANPRPSPPSASALVVPVFDSDDTAARLGHARHKARAVRDATGLTGAQRERVFNDFTAWEDQKGWP